MTIEKRKKRRRKKKDFKRGILISFCGVLFAAVFVLIVFFLLQNPHILKRDSLEGEPKESGETPGEEAEPESEEGESQSATEALVQETEAGTEPSAGEENNVEELLGTLTLEEKIAQMFVITPEALTGIGQVTAAGETTASMLRQYPVGGLVYFEQNLQGEAQIKEMLENTQRYSLERIGLPIFLCVDEEGGTVARISGRGIMDLPSVDTMASVGEQGEEAAYRTGAFIGGYLAELGFNVDFAPVADVAENPDNTVVGTRAFSSDPSRAAELVASFIEGMQEEKILSAVKHFPGHGSTFEDSHTSAAVSYKTLEELQEYEFLPFQSGIEAGADFVMAGHISLPEVTEDYSPASLSYPIITGLLRGVLGYDGVVITDGMNMAAVTEYYSAEEAAVQAVQAGVDIILMPQDFLSAYNGILNAVYEGRISQERINESLSRILSLKIELMG